MSLRSTITADLVLSISTHLSKTPEFSEKRPDTWFTASGEILKGWAKEIQSRKLSVSLEAISWNALRLAGVPGEEGRDLKTIGNFLIDRAEDVESFVALSQAQDLMEMARDRRTQPREDQLTAAFRADGEIPFSTAAKEISDLKNSTEARSRLTEYLAWMLKNFANSRELQNELKRIIDKRPKLSRRSIELLKGYYSRFLDDRRTEKTIESQLYGKFRISAQKTT